MMRLIGALLIAFATVSPSWAAVGWDEFAKGSGASPISLSLAGIDNVADRALIVFCGSDASGTAVTSISGAGATWGGSAFATFTMAGGAVLELWSGTGPSTGAQTVTVNHGAGNTIGCHVWSFNGVDQTTPLASASSLEQTASPTDLTYTTTNGDAVVLGFVATNAPSAGGTGSCNSASVPDMDGRTGPGANWQVIDHCLATTTSTKIGFNYNGIVTSGILGAIVKQASATPAVNSFPRRLQVNP